MSSSPGLDDFLKGQGGAKEQSQGGTDIATSWVSCLNVRSYSPLLEVFVFFIFNLCPKNFYILNQIGQVF